MAVVEVRLRGKVLFRGDVDSPKVEFKDGAVQVSAGASKKAGK